MICDVFWIKHVWSYVVLRVCKHLASTVQIPKSYIIYGWINLNYIYLLTHFISNCFLITASLIHLYFTGTGSVTADLVSSSFYPKFPLKFSPLLHPAASPHHTTPLQQNLPFHFHMISNLITSCQSSVLLISMFTLRLWKHYGADVPVPFGLSSADRRWQASRITGPLSEFTQCERVY